MKRIFTKIIIGSLFLLYGVSLQAQMETRGKDFWLSFGTNVSASPTQAILQIRIVADEAATGTITFTEMTGASRVVPFSIAAGSVITHTLTEVEKAAAYSTASTQTNNKSIRIQSDVPISVFALNTYAALADATGVLPTPVLGTDYYHLGRRSGNNFPDQYIIVATQDNTIIYENGTQVATLSEGQVYFKREASGADLSSYHITSNYPIAYFSAHSYCVINGGGDNFFQQLTSVNTWGKNFLVPVTVREIELIRILASENGTSLTVSNGQIMTVAGGQSTLNLNAGQWVELEIKIADKGCYIQANKPVQVCSYMVGSNYIGAVNPDGYGDESLAWIPPIEQAVKSALVAPFSVNSLVKHYAMIVTPTATKNNTSVSVGGATAVPLSGGTWYDNPESGMSFYSTELENNATTSYLFTNPAGSIIYGYGFGSAISYYYMAGSAMRTLDASFYANDVHNQDLPFEVFSVNDINFRGEIHGVMSTNPGHLKWYIDGVEATSARDQITWSKNLPNGTYQIKMVVTNYDNSIKTVESPLTISNTASAPPVTISGTPFYCSGQNIQLTANYVDDGTLGNGFQYRWMYSTTGDLTNFSSWSQIGAGATLNIPGNPGYYCALVGSPENIATQQYNFCVWSDKIYANVSPNTLYWLPSSGDSNWNDPTHWGNSSNNVLNTIPQSCTDVHISGTASNYPSLDTENTLRTGVYGEPVCHDIYFHFGAELAKPHLLQTYNKAFVEYNFGYFSGSTYKTDGDSYSATPMQRGQWYALATPLNKITPGDFSFGGKPDAWQQAFVRNNSGGTYVGQWDTPHNANATDVNASQYGGIAVWMANIENGVIGSDVSYQTNLNTLQGLIWMPYFEDATTSNLHRIHEYTGGQSKFYYYQNMDANQPIATSIYDAINRGNEAYKFVFDGKLQDILIPLDSKVHKTFRITVPAGKEIMIGNPFLSTLDFDKFYQINQNNLLNGTYRLYVDNNWGQQYTVGSGGSLTQNIAPLQAFFIQTKGSGNIDLLFPPDLVSVTNPTNKLKAQGEENAFDNVLYVQAANSEGNSWVTLGLKEGINVDQLFNEDEMYKNVPQIYLSDSNKKNAVQFMPGKAEQEILIGVKSQSKGNIVLSFNNIDRINAESLVLQDKLSGETYDLLRGFSQVTFKNTLDMADRFVLKIGQQTSGIKDNRKDSEIKVYMDGANLKVEASETIDRIIVTNMQGVDILNIPFINKQSISTYLNAPKGIYILNVMTINGEYHVAKIAIR